MRDDQIERLKSVLLELEHCDGAELEGRLAALVPDDAELRAEALSLLRQERSSRILRGPISRVMPDALREGPEGAGHRDPVEAGTRIGSYRLVECLGAGGMGVVWRAEQLEPIRRQVALKILRGGWDTGDLRLRFEAERRSLALMDHPNIARIYDAGADEEGQPFFAMELVNGMPITQFIKERELGTDDRLALLVQVCRAVQHAHQRGIIHRDLKPNNILVAESDGRASPRIIDFGIAKAIDPDRVDAAYATIDGQILGTLEYMSPEQATGRPGDVDVRTDIFSLGVILLEILTGQPPRQLRGQPLSESLKILAEAPISIQPRGAAGAAAMDEDLASIIRKATELEPARRYESAGALADDLERFRNSEPIAARPADSAYQLRMLLRRHRIAAAFTGVVAAALVAVGLTLLLMLAAERRALRQAELEAQRAEAINDFMSEVLASPRPGELGRDVRVVDALNRAVPRLGESFQGRPDVQASVQRRMAATFRSLGEEARGDSLAAAALLLGRQHLKAGDPELRHLLTEAGEAAGQFGRFEQADSLLSEALDLNQKHARSDVAERVHLQKTIGLTRDALGRHADAESLLQVALAGARRSGLRDELASLHNDLGVLYFHQGRRAEARVELEQALPLLERAGRVREPELATACYNLAICLDISTESARRDSLFTASMELYRRLEMDGLGLAALLMNIAADRLMSGRFASAESLQVEALNMYQAAVGRDHPVIVVGLNNLGYGSLCLDEPARAMARLSEAEAIGRRIDQQDANWGAVLMNLTQAHSLLGQHDRALRTARECVALQERLSPGAGRGAAARVCLGQAFLRAGRSDSALAVLSAADSNLVDRTATAIQSLELPTYRALSLADLGRDDEARAALRPLLPGLLGTHSPWLEVRNLRRESALRAERLGLAEEADALRRATKDMVAGRR